MSDEHGNLETTSMAKYQGLLSRCEHLEAGLKVIAAGDAVPMESPADGDVEIAAIQAFAQSTIDEAPEFRTRA